MYEEYWQLSRKPFETPSEQSGYYPSETHQGALLKLRYAVENRRGAALLAGPSGCGKTILIQQMRRVLPEGFAPFVHVVFPKLTGPQLLAYLADELGAPQGSGDANSPDRTVRRIDHFLAENTSQQRHAIIAIDEAQLLADTDALETVRLLLNFELAAHAGLTLLLVGQSSLITAVERLPSLDNRLGVKTMVRPFTIDETAGYIQHRLSYAGAMREIFEADAVEAVHRLSHGIARQIDRLCDLALLIGYAESLATLDARHVESVCEELVSVSAE